MADCKCEIPGLPSDAASVPGYVGYWVTPAGDVYRVVNNGKAQKLKPLSVDKGYQAIKVRRGKKQSTVRIHRMVLAAFVGPCPDGMESRHLDGNPANNHIENLVWGTHAENQDDKERHGKVVVGETVGNSVLTDEMVCIARRLKNLDPLIPYYIMAEAFGCSTASMARAVSDNTSIRCWKYLDNIEPPHHGQRRSGNMRQWSRKEQYIADLERALAREREKWDALERWLIKHQNEDTMPDGQEATAIAFDKVFAKMSTLTRGGERTCGGCGRFTPYDEFDERDGYRYGYCSEWDRVRADEPAQTAGDNDTPCDHWTPRGKEG